MLRAGLIALAWTGLVLPGISGRICVLTASSAEGALRLTSFDRLGNKLESRTLGVESRSVLAAKKLVLACEGVKDLASFWPSKAVEVEFGCCLANFALAFETPPVVILLPKPPEPHRPKTDFLPLNLLEIQ